MAPLWMRAAWRGDGSRLSPFLSPFESRKENFSSLIFVEIPYFQAKS